MVSPYAPIIKIEAIPLANMHSMLIDAIRQEALEPGDPRPLNEWDEWSAYRATISNAHGNVERFHIAYHSAKQTGAAIQIAAHAPTMQAWFHADTPERVLREFLEMKFQRLREMKGRRRPYGAGYSYNA